MDERRLGQLMNMVEDIDWGNVRFDRMTVHPIKTAAGSQVVRWRTNVRVVIDGSVHEVWGEGADVTEALVVALARLARDHAGVHIGVDIPSGKIPF